MDIAVACSIWGIDGASTWSVGVIDAVGAPPDPHAANAIPIKIQQMTNALLLRDIATFLSACVFSSQRVGRRHHECITKQGAKRVARW